MNILPTQLNTCEFLHYLGEGYEQMGQTAALFGMYPQGAAVWGLGRFFKVLDNTYCRALTGIETLIGSKAELIIDAAEVAVIGGHYLLNKAIEIKKMSMLHTHDHNVKQLRLKVSGKEEELNKIPGKGSLPTTLRALSTGGTRREKVRIINSNKIQNALYTETKSALDHLQTDLQTMLQKAPISPLIYRLQKFVIPFYIKITKLYMIMAYKENAYKEANDAHIQKMHRLCKKFDIDPNELSYDYLLAVEKSLFLGKNAPIPIYNLRKQLMHFYKAKGDELGHFSLSTFTDLKEFLNRYENTLIKFFKQLTENHQYYDDFSRSKMIEDFPHDITKPPLDKYDDFQAIQHYFQITVQKEMSSFVPTEMFKQFSTALTFYGDDLSKSARKIISQSNQFYFGVKNAVRKYEKLNLNSNSATKERDHLASISSEISRLINIYEPIAKVRRKKLSKV